MSDESPEAVKIHVLTTVAVVAAHVAVAFLWPPYFRLLVDCGVMVSDGNDIADVPRQGLFGAILVGLGWIVVANGFAAWWRRIGPLHER